MRRNWICVWTLVVVALGASVANASPITYELAFTPISAPAPTGGEFTYDSSTGVFTNFLVAWGTTAQMYTFDLTNAANGPTIVGDPCGGLTGSYASFALLTNNCPAGTPNWFAKAQPLPEFAFTAADETNTNYIWVLANSLPPAYGIPPANGTWTITVDPDGPDGPDAPGPEPDPGPTPSPEPSSVSLIASALLSGAVVARKRIVQGIRGSF